MQLDFRNADIIMISDNLENAKWILESLKISGMDNELIWLKDASRVCDYLSSRGLYDGKKESDRPKIFILDERLKDKDSVREIIESKASLSRYPIMSLTDSIEEFALLRKAPSKSVYFGNSRSE